MCSPPIVLRWQHGNEPRYYWSIRGINPDRSFYGDIKMRRVDGGKNVSVTGSLSTSDYVRLVSLANQIRGSAIDDDSDQPCDGILAEGPISNPHPRILIRYRSAKDSTSAAGQAFLEIVSLLAPYMAEFYPILRNVAPGATT